MTFKSVVKVSQELNDRSSYLSDEPDGAIFRMSLLCGGTILAFIIGQTATPRRRDWPSQGAIW